MSHEAFPLRHRGAHVPDHIRRLEEIATGTTSPRTRRYGASRALVVPQSRRDLVLSSNEPPTFAAFFRNLTVWVDQQLGAATAHACFDKIHMYMTLLRAFVDDVVPHPELQRVVEDLEAYAAYLSSTDAMGPPTEVYNRRRPSQPAAGGIVSPRTAAITKGVLSPRVLRAMAKDVAPQAALQSPRITRKRPKKIIELSDHEEAILELALYYHEVITQWSHSARQARGSLARVLAPSLTQQWLVCSTAKRASALKKTKRKIATQTLFPCASPSTIPTTPTTAARAASGTVPSSTLPAIHTLDLPNYFSLLTLCLHEITRRIGVFSAESAAFLSTTILHETLAAVETMLQSVLARQQRAHDAVETLKRSRSTVHDAIAHCESEIQRLQAQNVRSLEVWELEKAEMTMLEQEEAWHGHCKALLLQSLVALRDEGHHTTWFQISNDDTSRTEEDEAVAPTRYERLAVGAALLHSRLRSRLVYVTHLLVLCRSFLHLHEKRGLREVMDATATHPRRSESPSLPLADFSEPHAVPPSTPGHPNVGPMERISTNELLTLKDIHDTLRAIEELYATTGGSGDHSHAACRPIGLRGHEIATQFPMIDDPSMGNAFVRALAYSTVAAGNPQTEPAFVRAGSTRSGRRNAHLALAQPPPGSGRRLSATSMLIPSDDEHTTPVIRLNKAVPKLPRHVRDVLLLPLFETDPFPPDHASSIVEALSVDEILARVQWIYAAVLGDATVSTMSTPLALARAVSKSWNSEQFIASIHAAFLDKMGNDVTSGEREFLRFVTSIELLFSGLGAVLAPSGGAGATGSVSHALDKIRFFARLTQLVHLDAPHPILEHRLPAHVFQVFFYVLHVLLHVAVTKKRIEEGGRTIDVWTVPPATLPASFAKTPTSPRASRAPKPGSTLPTFRTDAIHAGQFVLLESARTLLLYLLDATSPDAAVVLDEQIQFLTDRATLARVALISPILPGAYDVSGSGTTANGELADAWILPLDFVVLTITTAWLQQHEALVDRLSIAMRAATVASPSGEISFDEFTHVMLVGAAASPSAAASPLRSGQLTQIYASLLARSSVVTWQALIVAATDDVDLLGMTERLHVVDMRSIQHAVLRGVPRTTTSSPWVAKPAYRGGDVAALRRAWDSHHATMREHFGLAFQSENTLEGLSLWQTGQRRMLRFEKLSEKVRRGHDGQELAPDDLAVAWRALYYLQVDHTQAHHVADHVRAKQLRGPR